MNNHIDELIKKFKCMPGSEQCLVVADLLEEMGDPNSEIIRHSLLLYMDFPDKQIYGDFIPGDGNGNGFGHGCRNGAGGGDGIGNGASPGRWMFFGCGCSRGSGDGEGGGECDFPLEEM